MSTAARTRIEAAAGGDSGGGAKGRAGLSGLLRVSWRQHRWPILITAAATAVLATLMLTTASDLASLAKTCALDSCGSNTKADSYATYQMNIVVFIPVLIAVFWGVPLVSREYEQRTLSLAWSQDISPLRWLWGKTAILGVLVAAMGVVLAGTAEHLAYEYRAYTGRSLFEGTPFQAGGWLPLTLMLAWLAFGIAAGAATRRTMPAIATVAALWFGRVALMPRLRPHFMSPLASVRPLAAMSAASGGHGSLLPGHPTANDMLLGAGNPPFVDGHGAQHSVYQVMNEWCDDNALRQLGVAKGSGVDPMAVCMRKHDIVGTLLRYQPAGRLGTFHLIENSVNLGLLVVSLLIAWWCVRRTHITT